MRPTVDEETSNYAGAWTSTYVYPSSSRGGTFTTSQEVTVDHEGDRLEVRSTSGNSDLAMTLRASAGIAKGCWTEVSDPVGYYAGRRFEGVVLLVASPDGRRLSGKWLGAGGDGEVNSGTWDLVRMPND
jgi:hypothetical protein